VKKLADLVALPEMIEVQLAQWKEAIDQIFGVGPKLDNRPG